MATKTLIDQLKQNKKIMIFPEGRLTMTGALMKVYEGPGLIADKSGAKILPVRIDGAQYSPTSRLRGKVRIRLFPKITLTFVTIQGRTKRFAKIAGEMVSLAAVETVVNAAWPGVNHAVVSIPDPRKGEMLVLLTEYAGADLDDLSPRFRLHGLTELSVPRRLVKLDKVPLLGTGKIDYVQARVLVMERAEVLQN